MRRVPNGLLLTCAVLSALSLVLTVWLVRARGDLAPLRKAPPLELDEPALR